MRQSSQLTVLLAQAQKEARKSGENLEGPVSARVRSLFGKLLAPIGLSKESISVLFKAAVEAIASGRPLDLLADYAEVFLGDYDTEADPLQPDDWHLIRDIINEEAGELDMQTVEYVMGLITERRFLD